MKKIALQTDTFELKIGTQAAVTEQEICDAYFSGSLLEELTLKLYDEGQEMEALNELKKMRPTTRRFTAPNGAHLQCELFFLAAGDWDEEADCFSGEDHGIVAYKAQPYEG